MGARSGTFTRRTIEISILLLLAAGWNGCARIRPPPDIEPIVRTMVTTGYCKCGTCCGWKRTWYGRPVYSSGPLKGRRKWIGVTASGVKAQHGTIAADTTRYPFGTIMYIPGYGYGVVQDRGKDIRGDHIDLYFYTHGEARFWGRKRIPVKIWAAPE